MVIFSREGLHIGIADAPNSIELRAEDANIKNLNAKIKQAENLKPKNCDCDCREEPVVVTEADDYLSESSDTSFTLSKEVLPDKKEQRP